MMKKAIKDAIAIKSLIKAGIPQIQIPELLGNSKQKVNYWEKKKLSMSKFVGKSLMRNLKKRKLLIKTKNLLKYFM